MGVARDWQEEIVQYMEGVIPAYCTSVLTVLNPRRDDWDSSWEQSIKNAQFREQVTWELDALAACSVIALCFIAGTQSPISLLELGLFAGKKPMIVHCSNGFWRKGNVDIVCRRYGISVVDNLPSFYRDVSFMMKGLLDKNLD